MRNNLATNVSIDSDSKKVICKIDCYIWHKVLLVIILLSVIIIICYHYAEHQNKTKQKSIDALTI